MYLNRALTIAIPAVVIFYAFYPYRRRALRAMGLRSTLLREIFFAALVATVGGIVGLTLRPTIDRIHTENHIWGDLILRVKRYSWTQNTNFVPILPLFNDPAGLRHGLLNLLGNIFMFLPIGLLVSALFRKASFRRALAVGLAFSAFIEVGQYFIGRATDVNDLILNTLGAISGYWLYLLGRRLWPGLCRKLLCQAIPGVESLPCEEI